MTRCSYYDVKDRQIITVEIHAWLQFLPRHRRCFHCGKEQIRTPYSAWIDQARGVQQEKEQTK